MTVRGAPLTARSVVDSLIGCGTTHVVWLPDTESGFLYETLRDEPRLRLVPVCREGEAVPVAAGLLVAGQKPVIIIQSTGLYESGDSLRGMAIDYRLPLLFLIGYRGYEAAGHRPTRRPPTWSRYSRPGAYRITSSNPTRASTLSGRPTVRPKSDRARWQC